MPEPTVIVRMKESAEGAENRLPFRDALGGVSINEKETLMTHPRYAFIKAAWHASIVDQALNGFCEIIPTSQVDVFDVPGAFEIPLMAQTLAKTGSYGAIIGAAFVVDGGIYRHEFVSQSVVDGLMRVGLDTSVPVLSVVLTPKSFQENAAQIAFFEEHFVEKGREAARAALAISEMRAKAA